MRRLSSHAHLLTRVRDDGASYEVETSDERRARTAMLYALVDNLGMSRRDANTAADAIEPGVPVTHGRYTFTLTPKETPCPSPRSASAPSAGGSST
jgi:hypothetical protein